MEELRRQEETRQQKLVKAREELAIAEDELENLPSYVPPKDELVSIHMSLFYYSHDCVIVLKLRHH